MMIRGTLALVAFAGTAAAFVAPQVPSCALLAMQERVSADGGPRQCEWWSISLDPLISRCLL